MPYQEGTRVEMLQIVGSGSSLQLSVQVIVR